MDAQKRETWNRWTFLAVAGMLFAFLLSRFLGTTGFLVLLGLVVVACGVYAGIRERRESGR